MDVVAIADFAAETISAPITRFWKGGIQTHWMTYFGAFALAGTYYLYTNRKKRSRLGRMVRYLWPRKIWHHPSTKLDVKLYLFTSMYLFLQAAFVAAFIPLLSPIFMHGLELFGPAETREIPLTLMWVLPLLYFLVIELAYWAAHASMHYSPVLWEFHKTHHSAEVMTPLTEWRQHPVEYMIFPLLIGPALSFTTTLVHWAFGHEPSMIWSVGVIVFLFTLTMVHLRHTHMRMSAPHWLAHVIQTPAHHHIHHSTEQRHFDKNFGYCLSLWDWAFGTLYLPEKDQRLSFGIDDTLTTNYRLRDHMLLPFTRAAKLLTTRNQS